MAYADTCDQENNVSSAESSSRFSSVSTVTQSSLRLRSSHFEQFRSEESMNYMPADRVVLTPKEGTGQALNRSRASEFEERRVSASTLASREPIKLGIDELPQ